MNKNKKKAMSIMVQGTTSNAGKSLLVAGLCRIFQQDGYKVAPFKAQNMALNSYITEEGLEMGRAQVVQAEAAKTKPSVLMNPILLKPTGDTKSQVIVNGKVWADMDAKEYYKNKREFVPEVEKAYQKLAEENDIIVIEGAGSPAEINLKENDIVNMFMAKLAKAPVLIVGDIDRGGVFAALVGTMALFEPSERDLVKGLVINKFRGDASILRQGMPLLTEKAGKPVLGIIPFLDIDIEDEDSLSSRLTKKNVGLVDIAIIKLPRLSNFTDCNIFETIDCVNLKYVVSPEELGNPDMIIIPGTKNTMEDLLWLRGSGLEAAIKKNAEKGIPIFGICGGYQMLGQNLSDPFGVEHGGEMTGIGLLPSETIFAKNKVTTQVTGALRDTPGIFKPLSNMSIIGYEVHMGETNSKSEIDTIAMLKTGRGEEKADGMAVGNVYGSYVHGFFDGEGIAETIVKILLEQKGLNPDKIQGVKLDEYKELQYDKLAQHLRKALDMEEIYKIINQGV